MRLWGAIVTNCSTSTPLSTALLPALLGIVDSQLGILTHLPAGQHTLGSCSQSPCHTSMAHSSLLSPVKARAFCSSGTSPALSPVRSCPPRSPARLHKRCLSGLQHCLPSGSDDKSSTAHGHHHQGHSAVPPPGPAAAAAGDDSSASCHAAKRLEVAQGSASKPCQPVTPAISQPEPLASSLSAVAAAGTSPTTVGAPSSTEGTPSPAPTAEGAAAALPVVPCALQLDGDGSASSSMQRPAPTVVMDAPPGLMPCPVAAAQQQLAGGSHQAGLHGQDVPMFNQRVAVGFDLPVEIESYDKFPDHKGSLGSGRLEVFVGPMFAGKTTALLDRVKELVIEKPSLLGVKSTKDKRYGNHWILSHGGKSLPCVRANSLAEFKAHLGPRWHKLQVIAIDEAQFFPDLVEFCQEAVDHDGKHIIVAGLSGDFKRRRFGQVLDLLPLADSVTQLTSICSVCGGKHGPALFSLRRVQGGPQEMVGGGEVYQATCRRCYLEHGGDVE